jgi:hypothetical protein
MSIMGCIGDAGLGVQEGLLERKCKQKRTERITLNNPLCHGPGATRMRSDGKGCITVSIEVGKRQWAVLVSRDGGQGMFYFVTVYCAVRIGAVDGDQTPGAVGVEETSNCVNDEFGAAL